MSKAMRKYPSGTAQNEANPQAEGGGFASRHKKVGEKELLGQRWR